MAGQEWIVGAGNEAGGLIRTLLLLFRQEIVVA